MSIENIYYNFLKISISIQINTILYKKVRNKNYKHSLSIHNISHIICIKNTQKNRL